MRKVFVFGFFSDFLNKSRNAPLASESLCLYLKDILDNNCKSDFDIHYVNVANSNKSFSLECNKSVENKHQIGTVSFGKLYRRFIWRKIYWKKVFRFCKKNVDKNDIIIIYHSLYLNKLLKKIKLNIGCKIILVGAELYSSVTNDKKAKKREIESYSYANAHILISDVLKKEINIERPSVILSGNYKPYDDANKNKKFSITDNKIHLVYSGTFDPIKGGVFAAIDAMNYLNDKYVLHILGFGDFVKVKEHISKSDYRESIIFEGTKTGKEFLDFLSKCDIGLSTQNSLADFNNSSFPSKIITYCKCGLSVVSTPSISVTSSPFKSITSFSTSCDPISIADAIKECKSLNNPIDFLKQIDKDFTSQFVSLLNIISYSNTYFIANNYYGGSTGNLARLIQSYILSNGNDCFFAYHIGKKKQAPYMFKYGFDFEHYLSPILTRLSGNNFGYMHFSSKKLLKLVDKIKPSILNLHCMNSYTLNICWFLNKIKKRKYKTIITNHALFYATGTCGHPYKECDKYKNGCGKCPNKRYSCKSFLIDRTHKNWINMRNALDNRSLYMTSVSDYVRDFCFSSPITKNICNETILNGIDVNIFKYHQTEKNDAKTHILYVSSSIRNSNKGFKQFLDLLDMFKTNKNFVFHVVGEIVPELKQYQNIICHGIIQDKNQLAKLYSMCDLFLITSRRETFSLPVAESLCCGTPVAGYKCGGPESFADSRYAKLFEFGNTKELYEYILNGNYKSIDKMALALESSKIYNSKIMVEKFGGLFERVLNNNE